MWVSLDSGRPDLAWRGAQQCFTIPSYGALARGRDTNARKTCLRCRRAERCLLTTGGEGKCGRRATMVPHLDVAGTCVALPDHGFASHGFVQSSACGTPRGAVSKSHRMEAGTGSRGGSVRCQTCRRWCAGSACRLGLGYQTAGPCGTPGGRDYIGLPLKSIWKCRMAIIFSTQFAGLTRATSAGATTDGGWPHDLP